ncbi:MAG: SBBP repeat-containing protein [Nostocaceae cyanobacterium]|nr:SBBP repeat-containing protein [Nostocaceae cyanobacterium]
MDDLEFLSVELLTPGSDLVTGDSNAILDLVFARAGSDVIYGFVPGSNSNNAIDIDIDFLFGDLFDNTADEFNVILQLASGNPFAILDADIPSVGADRFVLGDEFQPYYTSFDPLSLLTTDFLGFNQFAVIYDFAPDHDTIQLNGKKEDYVLVEVNNLPIDGVGTFSGEAIFSLQQGIPDLVSLVVSKPEVDLSLSDNYFEFVGSKPEDEPEEKKIGQLSTTGIDGGNGITVDAHGNIYVTGQTSGSLFADNLGFGDAWVVKYDTNANQVWGKQIGTAASDVAYEVVTDAVGNFYLAGTTGGAISKYGDSKDDPNASAEAWVGKYDSHGNEIWVRQVNLDGAFSTSGFGLQVDNDGNVYLSGLGIKENANPEIFDFTVEDDSWVTKFDSEGNQLWLTELDTFFFNESYDLAVDNDGNSYFVGWTQGLVGLNPAFPQQESDPSRLLLKYDAWLTKVNPDGSIAWIQQFGSPDEGLEFAWAVDTDSHGDIYVSGWTTGALGTQDKEFEKSEGRDVFLAKFDQVAGDMVWAKQIGSQGDDGNFLADLVVDNQDKIYLTGYTNGDLGDGNSDQSFNAWAGKFDTSGNNEWLRQFGVDDKFDYATGIDVYADQVFVTGYSEGYLGINGAEAAGGAGDAWIAQLKAEDGKLTKFVGNDAQSVIVDVELSLPVIDISDKLVTDDELPDGDNKIITTEGSTTGLTLVDYGEIGLSMGSAFDPNSNNSVQTSLLDAMINDPSVFSSDIQGLKLEGTDEVDDTLMGLMGDDEIKGKKGDDTLHGLAGNDKLDGEDGDDTLYGGAGADELKGGNQNDTFIIQETTEAEFDIFDGGSEELDRNPQGDTIVNDSGSDVIFNKFDDSWGIETFDGGGNAILGNAANNSLNFQKTTLVNVIYVDGGAGEDEIKGSVNDDTFRGGADKDKIEGKDGNDVLYGDGGTDELKGGKGQDTIHGGADNDKLNGEDDDDILIGGAGNDELDGNKGNDKVIGVDPKTAIAGYGEIDKLKGGDQSDTFVLGDATQAYYLGQDNLDYGLIDDFKLDQFDKIQLYGIASNYSLKTDVTDLPNGTAIFFGEENDLIGIVKDVKGLSLTDSTVFTFVV